MASAKKDFERFVEWVHQPATEAAPDVKRLANLALINFDELRQTVRQRSIRSIFLVDLARRSFSNASNEPPEIQAAEADNNWPWQRLRRVTIGPFRGFRTPESFDLQKRIILFYGPNGSGKTSFCEGLEYGLLGSVEEAETQRIEDRSYLTNLHAERFEPPILRATDSRGQEVAVDSLPDTFRFCFIEKNRIDAFSRIAARTPAKRTELIATLFGMNKFNEFVGHFNESIDNQLVQIASKQLALTAKRDALSNDQDMVNGHAEALQSLANDEEIFALTHSTGITFAGLKALIGTADAPGRLQQLENTLNAVPPAVIGLSRESVLRGFETYCRGNEKLASLTATLVARSSEASFKDLYTAVSALQADEGDHCPACDTPLREASTNPFDKAKGGLAQLKELSELQEEQKLARDAVGTATRELNELHIKLAEFEVVQSEQESSVGQYLAYGAADASNEHWTEAYTAGTSEKGYDPKKLELILSLADRIQNQDVAARLANVERQSHIAERDELNSFQLAIQAKDMLRQQLTERVDAAMGRIAAFDVENAILISEVAQEKLEIERDANLKTAYDRFLELLRAYRNQLPGTLLAGLNEAALNLYNEFNRSDLEVDKLAELHLPETGDQKIEISFRGNPTVRVDALSVLSEGHIRCLGLAILLAKGKSIESPLIVFDDVINAIDHDHRCGIRETIFESDHFLHTQLIVTCHSNEFIKDIEQHLPVALRGDCKTFLFRSHTGNYQPRVMGNVTSRNSVVKARASKDLLDNREALVSCRQGLEMLSAKVWRWLGSHDLGKLNLPLAGVGAEPGLRNLCDALRKRLTEAATFNHVNKPVLIAAYDRILGIPAPNLVWTYLNKGIHEEANRDEFDATFVEAVIQSLEDMDSLDLRDGR